MHGILKKKTMTLVSSLTREPNKVRGYSRENFREIPSQTLISREEIPADIGVIVREGGPELRGTEWMKISLHVISGGFVYKCIRASCWIELVNPKKYRLNAK
ncbi:MAG: hypothetical protein NQU46_07260 [Methanolinea sp.]|nr:hypothetical protein [Methanolinea sp.]